MSKPWETYVVKQGDHLSKIAFVRGCDPDTIWSSPKNEAIRAKRRTGNMLCAGDVLQLPPSGAPALDVRRGATNRYTATVPTVPVAVRLVLDPRSKRSAANQTFVVEGAGKKRIEGTTDAEGTARFEAPILVREVEVHFDALGVVLPVHVGDLDPIEEPSGVKQRLQNLGYLSVASEISDAALGAAVARFKREHGISPADATVDDDTREAIRTAHIA